ncbi:MAG TPA: hypothetical protein VG938_00280 [Verrucomicrobiae bacterium]|nr:hypothetical protein [Verrucomicrobiae bacterium]
MGIATLATTTLFAKGVTESVHFSAKVAFTNNGVEPGASGSVQATETMQGSVDKETMSVVVKGLTPNDPYVVTVTTVSNSNPVLLDEFNADGKGGAKLSFSNSGKAKTIGFVDGVLPLTGLAEVDIVNTNDVAVLSATRDGTSSLKYMVKKPMDDVSGTGASGTVTLSASTKKGSFNLTAAGLTGGVDYVVVVDGNNVATNTASAKGTLKISASPSPSNVLDASTITLDDATFTPVLTTAVP